jgi:uncharacterized membrane protein (UPF0127 family)
MPKVLVPESTRICALAFSGFLLTLGLASCSDSTKLEDLNATEITFPNGTRILAETMTRQMDLTRGLMFRDSLAQDRGMLFIHGKQQRWQYWMYNVRFPLDVIWMDRERRIVEIVRNTQPCKEAKSSDCPRYGGAAEALYVLELNAGGAARQGLKVGDVLSF